MNDIPTALRYSRAAVARIVGAQDADDVLQEAALRAWRCRKQFAGDAAYNTWFYKIAVRCALMHLRRERGCAAMARKFKPLPEKDIIVGPAKTPEELTAQREIEQRLYAAILELPPVRKRAALRCLREDSYGADGDTVNADKAARHKMREELRRRLCR